MAEIKRTELVAAYVRVSTQEQKLHGLSLDAQKMKLTEYAEENNMRIIEWYIDEGVSGRKLIKNRPELQRMIQDAEKGRFERIIFIKLDRFFRSVAEYHECMKRISPVLWSTTEEEYDLSTANGRMLVNMKLTIAELEADQTGERIDIVNEYKVTTGQPLTGSMPFCFKIVTDEQNGRKKIIKHPDYTEAMEAVLDFMFTHQNKRQALILLHTKYHINLDYKGLTNALKNTMLCGEYRGNTAYCEAFLTREEFDKLQAILKNNVKENSPHRDYIFSGLIKCPHCGRRLTGKIATTKKRGKTYSYKKYRCANHTTNLRCDFCKYISENVIEDMLLANIEKYLADAKIQSVQVSDNEDAIVLQKQSIEDIHIEIDRLNYSWRTGKIRTVEKYENDYAELMAMLEEAENSQGKTEVKDFSHIEAILHAGWREIYNNLTEPYKRAFWRSFIQYIEIEWTTETKKITNIKFF